MESGPYKNSPHRKYLQFMLLLLAFASFLLGLFYLAVGVMTLTDLTQYGLVPFINSLVYFGIIGFLAPVFFMLMRDFYNPVLADETGLHSKWFRKSLDVLWDDILGIRPMRLFGIFGLRNKYVVETKGSLFLFNVLYGILFGGTKHALLPVDMSINDYPKLIEKISKQTKKNRKVEKKRRETVH